MNERPSLARVWAMGVGVLLAGLMTASCTQTVTVPILLGDGYTIFNKEGLVPGEPLPQDFEVLPLPLCGVLPSRSDLQGIVAQGILAPFAGLIEIQSAELLDTTLEVTSEQGGFGDFTRLEMVWQPAAINGVPQPAISLGAAASMDGLTAPLVLLPPTTVDFLALLDGGTNAVSQSCPSLTTELAGKTPNAIPEWSIRMRLNVTGRIGF